LRYLPHTDSEIKTMLEVAGYQSIEQLFASIPQELRLKEGLKLPPALSELELRNELRTLSRKNAYGHDWYNFLGSGSYRHYIPSAVGTLISRSEFSTSYTPYQPEISQGTLMALFEYQTMVAEIMGMEIANASNYDGASSAAEAVMMAIRLNKRKRILLAQSLHPEFRDVIKSYLQYTDQELIEIPFDSKSGALDRQKLADELNDQCSCFVAGYPNAFGIVEDLSDVADALHQEGSLLITATAEPWSLGLVKSPGEMDVDIAVGEGRSIGNAPNYGGPSLGLFATRKKFVRQVPGRLVGETLDEAGLKGYVLTLSTREQHIRRERATSNICTNVSLCALAATITLSLVGREGFQKIAEANFQKAEDLKGRLLKIPGVKLRFSGTCFNEFAIDLPRDPEAVLRQLAKHHILGGIALKQWYPALKHTLLICVTEMNANDEIESYEKKLQEVLAA
jgi:glycine dehydrogenase subunit 1